MQSVRNFFFGLAAANLNIDVTSVTASLEHLNEFPNRQWHWRHRGGILLLSRISFGFLKQIAMEIYFMKVVELLLQFEIEDIRLSINLYLNNGT